MASSVSHGLLKPQVVSEQGLVVSKHPIASRIGAQILQRGGNAIDATIAIAFALGVVEPYMSGLGGIGIGLYWDGKQAIEVDGFTKTPKSLDLSSYETTQGRDSGIFGWPRVIDDRNIHGPLSVTVPTVPAVLSSLHGLGASMEWSELLKPAILLANEGVLSDWLLVLGVAESFETLSRYPSTAHVFLPGGKVPRPGLGTRGADRLLFKDLADSLTILADEGTEAFYSGRLGHSISEYMQSVGGYLSLDDLSDYKPRVGAPIQVPFFDHDIWVSRGLNGGPTLAELLGLIQRLLPQERDYSEVAVLKAITRAGLLAFEDRYRYMGAGSDLPTLWSSSYIDERVAVDIRPVQALRTDDSTTHISVVDSNGRGVSLTMTLLSRWGSHVVIPTTGILMNNGLMWCDPRSGKANSLAPDSIPLANMAPTLATKRGQLVGLVGASGGRKIMAANAQVLYNLICRELSAQQAVTMPRLDFSSSPVTIDGRVPSEICEEVGRILNNDMNVVYPDIGKPGFASPVVIWGKLGEWQSGVDQYGLGLGIADTEDLNHA